MMIVAVVAVVVVRDHWRKRQRRPYFIYTFLEFCNDCSSLLAKLFAGRLL